MESEITKSIIFGHFAGKSTVLQKRMIEEWLGNEDNKELFYRWLIEWENQFPQYFPDKEAGLDLFKQRMMQEDVQASSLQKQSIFKGIRWTRWAGAASLFLLLGFGGWINRDLILYQTYKTDFGETRRLKLPDGSMVTLNTNSSVGIPRFGFGKNSREVILKGEAAFSVVHTQNNARFIVKTDNHLDVVVLGTEFSVYSRERGTKVLLSKGKVQLQYQEGDRKKEMIMKPGDLAVLNPEKSLHKETASQPEKHLAWKDNRYVFENTTLKEFAAILADNYGLEVVIEGDELGHRTLEGSFKAESSEELLQIVSEIFSIRVSRKGDKIILTDNQP